MRSTPRDMIRFTLTSLLLALALPGLSGCGDSKRAAGGNATMRDMEVVDGTANDSMADLDNATDDGTLLSNISDSPPVGTLGSSGGNSPGAASNAADVGTPGSNTGAVE